MDNKKRRLYKMFIKLMMYENEGTAFQKIFENVMKNRYGEDFIKIKLNGRLGDKKNDGFLQSQQIYFQVYGPQDLSLSMSYALSKMDEDLKGIVENWHKAKEVIYVVNDKYKGIKANEAELLNKLNDKAKELENFFLNVKVKIWTCSEIEKIILELNESDIDDLLETPYCDDRSQDIIDFAILNEIVCYIMDIPCSITDENLFPPDYEKKMLFNGFSNNIMNRLRNSHLNADKIEEYFNNYGNSIEDDLRDKMIELYKKALEKANNENTDYTSDDVYVNLIESICKNKTRASLNATEALISYYFECCDIFNSPEAQYESIS